RRRKRSRRPLRLLRRPARSAASGAAEAREPLPRRSGPTLPRIVLLYYCFSLLRFLTTALVYLVFENGETLSHGNVGVFQIGNDDGEPIKDHEKNAKDDHEQR